MRISHNITALNTYRQYNTNTVSTNKSMEKLSSGSRINRAADDAAGLSISEKMRSQIRGLTQATRNAQDGTSFIQTAEGALSEVSDMLTRIKELTTQVKNGTYSEEDQKNIGSEMKALGNAITDIYVNTKFNSQTVFGVQAKVETTTNIPGQDVASVKGDLTDLGDDTDKIRYSGGKWQVDDGSGWVDATSQPAFSAAEVGLTLDTVYTIAGSDLTGTDVANLHAFAGQSTTSGALVSQTGDGNAATFVYGENGGQSVTVKQAKTQSLSALINKTAVADKKSGVAVNATTITDGEVEAAISEVNTTRAGYGALQNQLEHASNNMATTKENLQAAESRVRDVDMADEMMSYTKNNILLQASQAMLAQANQQPQGILQLLQ